MNWRDFFYFSKGERRALILLLSLIVIAWVTVVVTNKTSFIQGKENHASMILYPVCIYPPDTSPQTPEVIHTEPSPVLVKTIKDSISQPVKSRFLEKATSYKKTEKYPIGTIVELNTADTLILKKVPGIGSAFSNRIVKYRNLLGGFYSVTQLSEVYGIDEDRYNTLKEWFCVNPQLIHKRSVNNLTQDSLSRHPYINYRQAKAIKQLCRQKGKLTGWENIQLLEEFSDYDRERIEPYLSFE